jgi:hypothetical protein
VLSLWVAWKQWPSLQRQQQYLWLAAAPALLCFFLLSFRQHVNENWPAVFYIAAAPLCASLQPMLRLKRAIIVGAVISLLLYSLAPAIRLMGWQGHDKLDPFSTMRGWQQAGQEIGPLLAQVPRPAETFVVVLDHRHNASQMAFFLPQHPRVYRWTREAGVIESQYEVWPSPADKTGWDALIIYPDSLQKDAQRFELPKRLQRNFRSITPLGESVIKVGNGMRRGFQIFLGKDMHQWR